MSIEEESASRSRIDLVLDDAPLDERHAALLATLFGSVEGVPDGE